MKTNKKVMLSIALLMVNSAAFASEGFKDKAKKAASNALSKVANSMPTVDGAKQAVANGTAKAVNFVKVNAPTVAGTKQAVVNGASSVVDTVKSHPVATGAIIAGTAVVAGVAGTQKGRDAVKSAKDAVVTGFNSAATKTKAAANAVYDRMPNMPTLSNPFKRNAAQDGAQDASKTAENNDAANQDQGTLENTTPVEQQQEKIAAQVEAARIELAAQEEAARVAREQAFINDAVNVLDASSTSALKDMFIAYLSTVPSNARHFSQQGATVSLKNMIKDLITEANFPSNYNGTSLDVIVKVNYLLKLSAIKALNLTNSSVEYAEFLDFEIARIKSELQS